jgi:hypothetical protein
VESVVSHSFARTQLRRRGFVLATALLALLLIAALVASVLFAALEETRIASNAGAKERSLAAAESAIELTIARWSGSDDQSIGIAGARAVTLTEGGSDVTLTIIRLDSALYWVVADAGGPASRSVERRVGALVKVHSEAGRSTTIDRVSERWWLEVI